jgi:hypothetical protein
MNSTETASYEDATKAFLFLYNETAIVTVTDQKLTSRRFQQARDRRNLQPTGLEKTLAITIQEGMTAAVKLIKENPDGYIIQLKKADENLFSDVEAVEADAPSSSPSASPSAVPNASPSASPNTSIKSPSASPSANLFTAKRYLGGFIGEAATNTLVSRKLPRIGLASIKELAHQGRRKIPASRLHRTAEINN